jgi:hypothetical protein
MLCADGKDCKVGADCVSLSCQAGKCAAPTSSDGVKNGDETDVDCGGSTGKLCADTKGCKAAADCISKSCQAGKCAAPTATDGIKNGDETDVDCGGSSGKKCVDNKDCKAAADCASLLCNGTGKCAVPSVDGVKNGDETDVDCGGANTPKCADAKMCVTGMNCTSLVCVGKICQAPTPTDGVQNADETDIDCGGSSGIKCADAKMCKASADCNSLVCTNSLCQPPTDTDGVKNGGETGVDCGGTSPKKCGDGGGCNAGVDCSSQVCGVGTCQVPSLTDGVKNGTETDVDCGGTGNATQGCGTGKLCTASTDCLSQGCNFEGKCASGRTCKQRFGGNTCGAGEVGAAGAQHEDCCKRVLVKNGLDGDFVVEKYLITAGRMRAFVNELDGKVRTYMTANAPAWWNPAWTAYLPNSWDGREPAPVGNANDNLRTVPLGEHINIYSTYAQLAGGIVQDAPANQGCYLPGVGHPTFYVPKDPHQVLGKGNYQGANGIYGDNYNRWLTQDQLDTLPLNCTNYVMLAALCAYEGGQVISDREYSFIYDDDGAVTFSGPGGIDINTSLYPWGNADPAGGFVSGVGKIGPATVGFTNVPCPTCNTDRINWRFAYEYPATPAVPANASFDQANRISAPGRYPIGASRPFTNGERIQDISGLYIESTRTSGGDLATTLSFGDNDAANDRNVTLRRVRWRGGSWEGHGVTGVYPNQFSIMAKYGKMGTRCVYAP